MITKPRWAFRIGIVCLGSWSIVLGAMDGGPARAALVQKGKVVGSTSLKKSAVLDRLRDQHRPVVVFGPKVDDAKVIKQRHSWVGALPEAGIKDRDIVVVEVLARGEGKIGSAILSLEEAKELRDAFSVSDDAFAVVLIGRDGGEKVRWTEPVSAQEIFGKIDGMPMRQNEVKAKGGGAE